VIQTLRNAWKIPELRRKILFTLMVLFAYRLGAAIPVPFLNTDALYAAFDQAIGGGTIFDMLNMMSGNAFQNGTVFALSIQPYINASIIMQLLTVGVPALERLQKEGGEAGRKKIAAITRYATVGLAIVQGIGYFMLIGRDHGGEVGSLLYDYNRTLMAIVIVATFTAGSALIMWLGEQITEFGVGNGISIILFAAIVSRGRALPFQIGAMISDGQWYLLPIVAALFLGIIAFIVWMTNAERRIPVQYAKRVVGRKMYGGQSTHLPMKVNMSGVMPIIFAGAIASFPATIAGLFGGGGRFSSWVENSFAMTSPAYMVVYALLIIAFAYFYQSIQFNPTEISNNLKQNGGFIPGFRPGRPTTDFIKKVLNKITLFGALFLGLIAVLPLAMSRIQGLAGLAIGGTSILIVVGVALETVKQIESQMVMRHYKGFLE